MTYEIQMTFFYLLYSMSMDQFGKPSDDADNIKDHQKQYIYFPQIHLDRAVEMATRLPSANQNT